MSYKLERIGLNDQKAKALWRNVLAKEPALLKLTKADVMGNEYPLMVTTPQQKQLERMRMKGTGGSLKLSGKQLESLGRMAKTVDSQGSGFIKDIFSTLGKIAGPIADTFAPGSSDTVEKIGEKIGDAIEGSVNRKKIIKHVEPLLKEQTKKAQEIIDKYKNNPKLMGPELHRLNMEVMEKISNIKDKVDKGKDITSNDKKLGSGIEGAQNQLPFGVGMQLDNPDALPYGVGFGYGCKCPGCGCGLYQNQNGQLVRVPAGRQRGPKN